MFFAGVVQLKATYWFAWQHEQRQQETQVAEHLGGDEEEADEGEHDDGQPLLEERAIVTAAIAPRHSYFRDCACVGVW